MAMTKYLNAEFTVIPLAEDNGAAEVPKRKNFMAKIIKLIKSVLLVKR